MPPRKKPPAKASAEPALYVGARVIPKGSDAVYEITRVSSDCTQVDICLRRTNLERFRVPVSDLLAVA
jgi:hypothetical protein